MLITPNVSVVLTMQIVCTVVSMVLAELAFPRLQFHLTNSVLMLAVQIIARFVLGRCVLFAKLDFGCKMVNAKKNNAQRESAEPALLVLMVIHLMALSVCNQVYKIKLICCRP